MHRVAIRPLGAARATSSAPSHRTRDALAALVTGLGGALVLTLHGTGREKEAYALSVAGAIVAGILGAAYLLED